MTNPRPGLELTAESICEKTYKLAVSAQLTSSGSLRAAKLAEIRRYYIALLRLRMRWLDLEHYQRAQATIANLEAQE